MSTSLHPSPTIWLEPDAHRYAAQFAAEQVTSQKGRQVYLNTLAVYAVRTYLNWLAVPTALHQSDCWQGGVRTLLDVADLVLPRVGKLECRPVLPGDGAIALPPAADDCLGYVGVGLSETLDQANLLGFIAAEAIAAGADTIPLSQLRSLEVLLHRLDQSQSDAVNLRQWLQQRFELTWQPPLQVLSTAFRSSARADGVLNTPENAGITVGRGKVIFFPEGDAAIALVLQIASTALGPEGEQQPEEYAIHLQIFPSGQAALLPEGLEIKLLDGAGTLCAEARSREGDDGIQLEFGIAAGEWFSLHLTLNQQTICEEFQT